MDLLFQCDIAASARCCNISRAKLKRAYKAITTARLIVDYLIVIEKTRILAFQADVIFT